MSLRAILKQAIADVKAGQDRKKTFETYLPQVKNPKHLSMAIASVPKPELQVRFATLNYVLVGLLAFAAITKLLMGLLYFFQYGAFVGIFATLLGVVIPVIFAVAVFKMEGQVYSILVVLCSINILNVLVKVGDQGIWVVPDVVLLVLIAVLAGWLRSKLFPNMGWLGVKKDSSGAFIF